MPSESQQIMQIFHEMVDAKEQEQQLREQVEAANSEGVDVSVPMSVFMDIQERR
jgi:hypothetical protein